MIQIPVTEESFLAEMAKLRASGHHGTIRAIQLPWAGYYAIQSLSIAEQDLLNKFWRENPSVRSAHEMEFGPWLPR